MQDNKHCVKLTVKDGWGRCPHCGRKLLKVLDMTIIQSLPVKCKRCKREIIVNIEAPEPESKATSA